MFAEFVEEAGGSAAICCQIIQKPNAQVGLIIIDMHICLITFDRLGILWCTSEKIILYINVWYTQMFDMHTTCIMAEGPRRFLGTKTLKAF